MKKVIGICSKLVAPVKLHSIARFSSSQSLHYSQPFNPQEVIRIGTSHNVYLTDHRLRAYYYQIQQCIVQYGGLSPNKAKELVDNSHLFTTIHSTDFTDVLCNDVPYFYAMMLLHGDEEQWENKYWPPPKDEIICNEYEFYMKVAEMENDNPTSMFRKWFYGYQQDSEFCYHGCTLVPANKIQTDGINLSYGRDDLDFNPTGTKGFYLTKYIAQAKEWAMRCKDDPVIVEYKINSKEIEKFKILRFGPNDYARWAKFVVDARKSELSHDYDAVEGPTLANPQRVLQVPSCLAIPCGHQLAIFSPDLAKVFDRYCNQIMKI